MSFHKKLIILLVLYLLKYICFEFSFIRLLTSKEVLAMTFRHWRFTTNQPSPLFSFQQIAIILFGGNKSEKPELVFGVYKFTQMILKLFASRHTKNI